MAKASKVVERGSPLNTTRISPGDAADIQRLRSEGEAWNQIAETKYPDRKPEALRDAFMRQYANEEESTANTEEEEKEKEEQLFLVNK